VIKNATLVAYYGDKPSSLRTLIEFIQARAEGLFGSAFSPYRVEQVHATIIGLEGLRNGAGYPVNANYRSLRGQTRVMDIEVFLEHLKETPLLPFTVRIGGFEKNGNYPFTSGGEHAFARTFSLQGANMVIMGWPTSGGAYPTTLARLRRESEAFGVLHKYHPSDDSLDNDLFMVLGRVDQTQVKDTTVRATIEALREQMKDQSVELTVDATSLQIVSYVDPALPLETSTVTRLADADADAIAALYGDR
jgi:hypothetical protein